MRLPRASGILLHPTSLPGPHGAGDFGPDAYRFVDWLVSAGQSLWQVLPLGGIGPGNSPYMSSSAFAGNVLLVALDDLQQQGWLDVADLLPAPAMDAAHGDVAPEDVAHEDAAHGDAAHVDYAQVQDFRLPRLQRAAAAFAEHGTPGQRAGFDSFCATHANWLDDYALFMALREAFDFVDWCTWPAPLAQREAAALDAASVLHAPRVQFWKFCQWRFYSQWLALRAYANGRGVGIVGDTPIFIAHQSAEVWAHQDLFELDASGRPTVVAGVPPDYFSATGQRWGNPLYRWTQHARDGYAWWVERVRRTFELVDVVRIDHFRGFAAHWEIAADEPTAVHGRWVPGPGAALFEAISDALGPLPIIAEDLGLITPDVDALRKAFNFPGMCILQFAFSSDARNLYLPHNHQPDSVVYAGTHDNDTVAGWWHTATDHERQMARAYLATDGHDMPWAMIRAAMSSVADTAVHTLQDVLSLPTDCRMNFPGQAAGWWRWRFQWSQLQPWHAGRLAALSRLYGRA